jgi:PIN domain nuclease of toxin-antitoxin system
MSLLLDTHLLLWGVNQPIRLSAATRLLLADRNNQFVFSAASMWEIAIKRALGRADFAVDPRMLRRNLLDSGFRELTITSEHGMWVANLPLLHRDPFDRLLIAQATVEGITLLTSDSLVSQYPGPIRLV